MTQPIAFYPDRNGFYSGSEAADIFVYEGGKVQLYLNGMNKITQDGNDILRIKNWNKEDIRFFIQNKNLIIQSKKNYVDVLTIMDVFRDPNLRINNRILSQQEEIHERPLKVALI